MDILLQRVDILLHFFILIPDSKNELYVETAVLFVKGRIRAVQDPPLYVIPYSRALLYLSYATLLD